MKGEREGGQVGGASCHVKAVHKQPVLKCMMGRGGEKKEWAIELGRKRRKKAEEEQDEEQVDGQEAVKEEEVGGTVQSGGQWKQEGGSRKQEGGSGSEKSSSRRGSY